MSVPGGTAELSEYDQPVEVSVANRGFREVTCCEETRKTSQTNEASGSQTRAAGLIRIL